MDSNSISNAEFISSASDPRKLPSPHLPEYAFIGRSNVGKSSLINMICRKKDLARVSKKPGKTKLINHFLIKGINKFPNLSQTQKNSGLSWYLVDLPGYGYAGVSKQEKAGWVKWLDDYLLKRENLLCVFVLLDLRLPPQEIDLEFMEWLGKNNVPFSMAFTKADKLSSNEMMKNIALYKKTMLASWAELPHIFVTSSLNKKGREEILWFIEETNKSWQPTGQKQTEK